MTSGAAGNSRKLTLRSRTVRILVYLGTSPPAGTLGRPPWVPVWAGCCEQPSALSPRYRKNRKADWQQLSHPLPCPLTLPTLISGSQGHPLNYLNIIKNKSIEKKSI